MSIPTAQPVAVSPETKRCCRCRTAKPTTEFSLWKKGMARRSSWCKPCHRAYYIDYRDRLRKGKYREVTEKKCCRCGVVKKPNEFFRRTASPDCLAETCKVCHTANCKELRRKLRQEVIDGYGGKCECCGERRIEFLQIDHKFNDGAAERRFEKSNLKDRNPTSRLYRRLRRQGFPRDRHQVLCANCNIAKGIYGYCPHERERNEPCL